MKGIVVVCEDRPHAPPYIDSLRAVGVADEKILLLTPDADPPEVRRLAAASAGVLLCGGPDMEPWRYGEEPLAGADLSLLPILDEIELAALAGARETRAPVFGVCRGMQTVNVYFDGSLWQDLPLQVPGAVRHRLSEPRDALAHTITVTAAGTVLGELLAREPEVNSRHHQAIKQLGRGLRSVAASPDGLSEAMVLEDGGWWVEGVQWHPENLLARPPQRELWRRFAAACGLLP